jgi:iron complex transport system substrate-binding protein
MLILIALFFYEYNAKLIKNQATKWGENNMNKRLIIIISVVLILSSILCSCAPKQEVITEQKTEAATEKIPSTRVITDMAGRIHEINLEITKVFATNPVGTTLVYTLSPDKLLGWNYQFNDLELAFIADEYKDLPVYGTIKNANYEALISAGPDIIISAAGVDEKTASKIDKFQDQLGIPIIMVDESLINSEEAYSFLGEVLNEQEKAKKLSDYAKKVLNSISSNNMPEENSVSIYFGNGINSLNTSSRGTPPSESFDLLGALNVCNLQGDSPDRIEVTPEHIIEWNPDYIFINGEPTEDISSTSAVKSILENESYKNINAVKKGKVINIPNTPFAWLDRPRSSNRLLGLQWAGSIIYPDYFEFSSDDVKEFYSLFYHIDITDVDIEELFN